MAAGRQLTVVVSDERGRRLRVRGLASWLRRVAPSRARGSVGVAIVSDARIRALNRTYRRKDYATDVLSFPSNPKSLIPNPESRIPNPESLIPNPDRFLGDIAIARGIARRQAREAGHPEATELRILALHGLLHLLGYDHERDNGRMRRLEGRLRRKGGLEEGLIERVTRQ
jgi:probable rRNA maturation factor